MIQLKDQTNPSAQNIIYYNFLGDGGRVDLDLDQEFIEALPSQYCTYLLKIREGRKY